MMQAIAYYISLPFIYAIAYLPFWWLYRVSDITFFMVYHVFGYRKQVVMTNLINSFPEKSEVELKVIQRKFYRYFCDLILETVKSLTITPKQIQERIQFSNKELLQQYYDQNQSVILVMGHWGNWELGGARFAVEPFHRLFVIYKALHLTYFDKLVYHMRTRLGNGLYEMNDSLRGMLRDRKNTTATAFIADQTPSTQGAHWMQFMHQETPVFTGAGKLANKLKYPVIYVGIDRVKRGYYHMNVELLVEEPGSTTAEDIVEKFTQRLEIDINKRPEIWLWTHRRWKHKRENL